MPSVITSVARIGRPFAMPPSSENTPCPGARLDHPGEEEQAGGDEPVADRVQHGAVEPEVVDREDPEHDQAHLGHRGVRDDAADVRLAEREHRAVDERRRGEHEHERRGSRRPARGSAAARSRRARRRRPSRRRPRGSPRPRAVPRCTQSAASRGTAAAAPSPRTRRGSRGTPSRSSSSRSRRARNVPWVIPKATIEASISSEPAIV